MIAPTRLVPAILLASFLVGCTGDVDPLAEAIEVRDLDLVRLSIERPENTLTPLRINARERLRFSLRGTNSGGESFELGSEGRNWRVSDPSVATVDANGELLALSDGDITVDVRIGDIAASPFDVSVLTRPVGTVERIVGPDLIDPCVVQEYHAIGGFGQIGERVDERLLMSATWRVEGAGAELDPQDDGSVRVSGSRPGTITLFASFNEAQGGREVVIDAAPTSLTVLPSSALTAAVGSTVDLSAVAVYAGENDASRQETVTEGVDWQVVSGTEFVTIGNDLDAPSTRGRVRAVANDVDGTAGVAGIRAVCGDVASATRVFTVRASTTTGSSSGDRALSFLGAENAGSGSNGGTLDVFLRGDPVQLAVSRGTSYDDDEDVTLDTDWSLVNLDDSVVGTVSTSGRFIPNSVGTVQVRAENDGRVAILTINVI